MLLQWTDGNKEGQNVTKYACQKANWAILDKFKGHNPRMFCLDLTGHQIRSTNIDSKFDEDHITSLQVREQPLFWMLQFNK